MAKQRRSAAEKRIYDAALKLYADRTSHYEVPVSDLAEAAGVARGTIYNRIGSPEALFSDLATKLASEMAQRVAASYAPDATAAERLAIGIRLYVRRAHEEQHWGRFLLQFGMTDDSLRELWIGPPSQDIKTGIAAGEYDLTDDELLSALGLIAGATLSGILLVLQGFKTWRDAGSETARLALRALGIDADEARRLAELPLPELRDL